MATPDCPYCGKSHTTVCPRVKAMEFWPGGSMRRIEFFKPNDGDGEPKSAIIVKEQPPPPPPPPSPPLASSERMLSPCEAEVLRRMSNGHSNKIIARSLGIAVATVKVHAKAIYRKINCSNRTQAAVWFHSSLYISPPRHNGEAT